MNIDFIRQKVKKNQYDLSGHAHNERQEEQITTLEIEQAILEGDIIERYPNDPRGISCLIGCMISNKPLHVVCGLRNDKLLIVTVYRPKEPVWLDYKTRAKELKSRV